MRTKYKIIVDEEEHENVNRALEVLNVRPASVVVISFPDSDDIHVEYTIELSKYELLYLRLACKSNRVINLSDTMMFCCD